MPPLVPEPAHAADPLPPHLASEHRSDPVPPHSHRLVTDIDPALEQQVFHVPQVEREAQYISTTSRITSGDELKYRKGLSGLHGRGIG
jgi:hypothetical protein